jgi:hypothetical protein
VDLFRFCSLHVAPSYFLQGQAQVGDVSANFWQLGSVTVHQEFVPNPCRLADEGSYLHERNLMKESIEAIAYRSRNLRHLIQRNLEKEVW